MFYGSIVASITPFKEGKIDLDALAALVDWHIAQGTHGIVACGSTGESFCLTHDEHRAILETCVRVARGRIPILAGTGCMTTEETIQLTAQARECAASGVLIVTPPYLKPSQEALYEHYKAVHEAVEIPILLYNNPGRTGGILTNETISRLARLPRIVGVKDSTGDLSRVTDLARQVKSDFVQICGEDSLIAAFLAQGGHGMISVSANVAPRLLSDLYEAWTSSNQRQMSEMRDRLAPLFKAVFCESNPVPVKYAVSRLGFCTPELRRPLLPATLETQKTIDQVMDALNLLTPLKNVSHG